MLLHAQKLTCIRGPLRLFSGLDLTVASGEALLLRGTNGSGKSSLLRILASLSRADEGALSIDEVPVWEDIDSYRHRIHYVGHLEGLKAALTVRENLHFSRQLRGEAADSSGELPLQQALNALNITHLAELPVHLLSAGQRKRAALARLAAVRRPIWLLDEPTTALDTDGINCLLAMLHAHRQARGIAVVASHGDLAFDFQHTIRLPGPDVWLP